MERHDGMSTENHAERGSGFLHIDFAMRYISNKAALITKVHRKLYLKLYPTLLVQPNGATITIRHFEPRKIIKLPLDFSSLSEEEKQIVLEKRKPKKKVIIEDEIDDNFSAKKYVKLLKKKGAQ